MAAAPVGEGGLNLWSFLAVNRGVAKRARRANWIGGVVDAGKCQVCEKVKEVHNHKTVDGSVTLLVCWECSHFVEDIDLALYDVFPTTGGK